MNTEQKLWGSVNHIFNHTNFSIDRLSIVKNGYSSKHIHEYKNNGFFIEKGQLLLSIWQNDVLNEILLDAENFYIVPPKVLHMFYAIQDTILYEVYWPNLIDNDIIRYNTGGVRINE